MWFVNFFVDKQNMQNVWPTAFDFRFTYCFELNCLVSKFLRQCFDQYYHSKQQCEP
jgi:hypothetical protein